MLRVVEGRLNPLDAYDENDDVVTEFVEPAPAEPKWLVRITPFDRRSMSREDLLTELREGGLVRSETLVWRRGMHDWLSVAQAHELGAFDAIPSDSILSDSSPPDSIPPDTVPPTRRNLRSEPAPPPRSLRVAPRRPPSEAAVVLASSATSLLIVGVTLALLAWAGAFAAARPVSERRHSSPRTLSESSMTPLIAAPVAAPSASR
jgi:hypothetical protein